MLSTLLKLLPLLILFNSNSSAYAGAESEVLQFRIELRSLFKSVFNEKPYNGVFLLSRQPADCIDEDLQSYISMPQISFDAGKIGYLKGNFSSEMLAVMCLNTTNDELMIEQLATNLQHMRTVRVLVLVNAQLTTSSTVKLEKFFENCMKRKLLNVNLYHRDFVRTQRYHSYTQLPNFAVEEHQLTADNVEFPYRLSDLRGKVLRTFPDQIEPRTLLYKDTDGRVRMRGYIGRFMHAFEDIYNCSFEIPHPYNLPIGHLVHRLEVRRAARNDTIDIGASISSIGVNNVTQDTSDIIEIVKWLSMLPVESVVPTSELLLSFLAADFMLIIPLQCLLLSLVLTLHIARVNSNWRISVQDILFNDASLRSMMVQSFQEHPRATYSIKFIYTLMFLAGLIFNTSFSAYCSIMLTVPPTQKPINSYDDALQRNLKILLPKPDVAYVIHYKGQQFWNKYGSLFEVVELQEYLRRFRNLDTRFAFPTGTSLWTQIHEQQKYFSRQLFRLSPELSICDTFLFAMPMNENSIYKEPLNRLIVNVHDSGIFDYWFRMSFYDLVALHKVSLKDLSEPRKLRPLNVGDFDWILVFYGTAMCVCFVVFLLEKLIKKLQQK